MEQNVNSCMEAAFLMMVLKKTTGWSNDQIHEVNIASVLESWGLLDLTKDYDDPGQVWSDFVSDVTYLVKCSREKVAR